MASVAYCNDDAPLGCFHGGVCDSGICICQVDYTGDDCSIPWTDYHSLYLALSVTCAAINCIQLIIGTWRVFIVLHLRWRQYRAGELGGASYWNMQVVCLSFVWLSTLLMGVYMTDPMGVNHLISTDATSELYTLFTLTSGLALGYGLRIFIVVQSKFHAASARTLRVADIAMTFYVLLFLFALGSSPFAPPFVQHVMAIATLIVGLAYCFFVGVLWLIYGLLVLRPIVVRARVRLHLHQPITAQEQNALFLMKVTRGVAVLITIFCVLGVALGLAPDSPRAEIIGRFSAILLQLAIQAGMLFVVGRRVVVVGNGARAAAVVDVGNNKQQMQAWRAATGNSATPSHAAMMNNYALTSSGHGVTNNNGHGIGGSGQKYKTTARYNSSKDTMMTIGGTTHTYTTNHSQSNGGMHSPKSGQGTRTITPAPTNTNAFGSSVNNSPALGTSSLRSPATAARNTTSSGTGNGMNSGGSTTMTGITIVTSNNTNNNNSNIMDSPNGSTNSNGVMSGFNNGASLRMNSTSPGPMMLHTRRDSTSVNTATDVTTPMSSSTATTTARERLRASLLTAGTGNGSNNGTVTATGNNTLLSPMGLTITTPPPSHQVLMSPTMAANQSIILGLPSTSNSGSHAIISPMNHNHSHSHGRRSPSPPPSIAIVARTPNSNSPALPAVV